MVVNTPFGSEVAVVPRMEETTTSRIVRTGIMLLPTITLRIAAMTRSRLQTANGFNHFFISFALYLNNSG
jgi:hypothetical protein